MKNIKVKLIDGSQLPNYSTDGAAGADLRSRIGCVINSGESKLIPTGITISIPKGYAGFVQPRSGLALKSGITVLNTPGLIDSDFRGEIGVILINHSKEKFMISIDDRIAQLVIQKVEHPSFELVDELDVTQRGAGGFGSTGVSK